MCTCNELATCCSVVEVGYFCSNETVDSVKTVMQNWMECYYDIEYEWEELPTYFIATTHNVTQKHMEPILKQLGFRPKKFKGRHQDNNQGKYLTFWTKTSLRGLL